jgi:hypothetical protein
LKELSFIKKTAQRTLNAPKLDVVAGAAPNVELPNKLPPPAAAAPGWAPNAVEPNADAVCEGMTRANAVVLHTDAVYKGK